jgi:isoaspartyl peptidase/L-asparaginase-like protein (Ntn-hydrolase superfamily)
MRLLGEAADAALGAVFAHDLPPLSGGAVAVDARGRLCAAHSTLGMLAGLADSSGRVACWHRAPDPPPADPDPH